jgi:hypothetical protein
VVGGKKQGVATGAVIGAFALVFELPVNLAVRTLGAGLAENVVLLGSEVLLPLGVGLDDFSGGLGGDFGAGFHDGSLFVFGGARGEGEGKRQRGEGADGDHD